MKVQFIALLALILFSCDPPPRPIELNKFKDFEIQKIYTHQYNRTSDSLYQYLEHSNPLYRAEAAISFASIQDSNALEKLYPLLNDTDSLVRTNSAFAIGQTRHVSSGEQLIMAIKKEQSTTVKRYLLEALGRTATDSGLEFLSAYKAKTNLETIGQAWGIYRSGLKNLYSDEAATTMLQFVNDTMPYEARLAAGHYFYRFNKAPAELLNSAINIAKTDTSPELRMVYARVLKNFNTPESTKALVWLIKNDSIYNVRVDAIRALKQHPFNEVKADIWKVVQSDSVLSVRIAASEFFGNNENPPDFLILNQAMMLKNWRIQGNMLLAFLSGCVSGRTADTIKAVLIRSDNKYQKQLLLPGLLNHTQDINFAGNYLLKEADKDVILSASYTINSLLNNGQISKEDFKKQLINWLQSDNEYLVRQAAHFLCKPGIGITVSEEIITNALVAHKRSDDSVLDALTKATNILYKGQKADEEWYPEYFIEPEEFRTFNWNNIVSIPKDLKIDVITEKGVFTMQLMVEDAPFTVAHFIELIKEDFFEGMPFYRVIPNFVNQSGGAKDERYEKLAAIRIKSELPIQWHRTATVNMASYGKDTESSHFSIMLCPTPWNDNNYTIFAKVVYGMELVHTIEMGDMIYGMEILASYEL